MKKSKENDLIPDVQNNNSLTEIREPSNLFTFSPKEGFDFDKNDVCDPACNLKDENIEKKAVDKREEYENKVIESKMSGGIKSNERLRVKGSFEKMQSLEVLLLLIVSC